MRVDEPLPPDLQEKLDKAYLSAFALSRAKGVADAIALSGTEPLTSLNRRHGMDGRFDDLIERVKMLGASPAGAKIDERTRLRQS
jgi:hypothetical protein